MAAEGGSSEGSSSDKSDDDSMDDLELLLLQNVFCGREFDVHLNFEDISEDDFPSLFRWTLVYLNALHLISPHLTRSPYRDMQKSVEQTHSKQFLFSQLTIKKSLFMMK